MKINLNKNLRRALISVLLGLIVILSLLMYKGIAVPEVIKEKVPLYEYKKNMNAHYNVFFEPNILYDSKSQGEENIYITKYVDYIKASFDCRFLGEDSADISGNYKILAVAEGYTGEENDYKTIWEKKYNLLSQKSFKAKDNEISITEEILIDLEKYNNFVRALTEDSEVNTQAKLSVFMNVDLTALTDKGKIEENMSPAIVVPLNTNYFQITKEQTGEVDGVLKDVREISQPIDKTKIVILGVTLVFLIIILAYLGFFTYGETKDPLVKQLKIIFKKYGNRIVALNNEIKVSDNYYTVYSIDDLVKISDEIEKPIMYKYCSDYNNIYKFYVFDEYCTYIFDLKDYMSNSKQHQENESSAQGNAKNQVGIKSFEDEEVQKQDWKM